MNWTDTYKWSLVLRGPDAYKGGLVSCGPNVWLKERLESVASQVFVSRCQNIDIPI